MLHTTKTFDHIDVLAFYCFLDDLLDDHNIANGRKLLKRNFALDENEATEIFNSWKKLKAIK